MAESGSVALLTLGADKFGEQEARHTPLFVAMNHPLGAFVFNRFHFLLAFFLVVLGLLGLRSICPEIVVKSWSDFIFSSSEEKTLPLDFVAQQSERIDSLFRRKRSPLRLYNERGKPVAHKILSVPDYGATFPDLNDVQLATAYRIGVSKCENRAQVAQLAEELVYIDDSPYYEVASLKHSIPYLVPRAATLLKEIGRSFIDSLAVKGVPFHKLQVTSVLRTEEDVARLRRRNANASENSCHRFATTFDISYRRFHRVQDPDLPPKPELGELLLKQILAEVLRDQRERGTCYVKYEVHQACFHITAR